MTDVFLSYSREDQAIARRFAEALEAEGFSVWWDQALDAGEAFDRVTEKALDEARAVVVLWSKHSADSNWVRAEATQAHASGRLVPAMIEPCRRPIMFELTQTADLSGWEGDRADPRWSAFARGLRRSIGGSREARPAQPIAPPATVSRMPARRWAWAATAAVLVALAGGAWLLKDRFAASPAAATPSGQPSIAVLPFDDMSPGKDQGYLADGLAEEILNSLARIPGLTVFARNSTFEFRTRGESLKQFGHTLGATHLLGGSLRKSGDQLRVTAQLIDARTEAHVWSRTYDRPLQDVFKVQEEIAGLVAQTLQVSLGVGENAGVPGTTRNVEAWDALLACNQGLRMSTGASIQHGIDECRRAVTLDPQFAVAWSLLADIYLGAASFLPAPSGATWQQRSDQAFEEARRLAPDAFYVYSGLIARALQRGDWKAMDGLYEELAAKGHAQRGIPVGFNVDRALFLLIVGRFREAIALLERERVSNPLDGTLAWYLAELYADSGDLQKALAEFDRGATLGGPFEIRQRGSAMLTALAVGDVAQIQKRLDDLAVDATGGPDINNARIRRLLGEPRETALAELRRLAPQVASTPQVEATLGAWAAYFDDPEFAFSIFGAQAATRRSVAEIFRLWRPLLRDMRRLPEFRKLVADIGLVDYWRETGWGEPCRPITGTEEFECH